MLTRKIKLWDINAHITCRLCSGYLIDATTVTECLHTCEYGQFYPDLNGGGRCSRVFLRALAWHKGNRAKRRTKILSGGWRAFLKLEVLWITSWRVVFPPRKAEQRKTTLFLLVVVKSRQPLVVLVLSDFTIKHL